MIGDASGVGKMAFSSMSGCKLGGEGEKGSGAVADCEGATTVKMGGDWGWTGEGESDACGVIAVVGVEGG